MPRGNGNRPATASHKSHFTKFCIGNSALICAIPAAHVSFPLVDCIFLSVMSEAIECLLLWLFRGRCDKHVGLSIGFADALAGYVEIVLVNLNSDELAA